MLDVAFCGVYMPQSRTANVAQLVEHSVVARVAAGSSPVIRPTKSSPAYAGLFLCHPFAFQLSKRPDDAVLHVIPRVKKVPLYAEGHHTLLAVKTKAPIPCIRAPYAYILAGLQFRYVVKSWYFIQKAQAGNQATPATFIVAGTHLECQRWQSIHQTAYASDRLHTPPPDSVRIHFARP